MSTLFDAHCHLQDLASDEVAAALARARAAGVTRMACCATREEDWGAVLDLAATHPEVVPLLGLHPWYVASAQPGWAERLEGLLVRSRAGLGECGLDFARRPVDRERQMAALRLQLRLAERLQRPIVLHCVRAWGALSLVLREEGVPQAGAMVHAFGGSAETARELQREGLYLSFKGRAEAWTAVREDRLLLESDGPEPAAVAALLAGAEPSDLARRSQNNAARFFERILG